MAPWKQAKRESKWALLFALGVFLAAGCGSAGNNPQDAANPHAPPFDSIGERIGEVRPHSAVVESYLLSEAANELIRRPYLQRNYTGESGWAAVEYSAEPLKDSFEAPISPEALTEYRENKKTSRFTEWRRIPQQLSLPAERSSLEQKELAQAGETDYSFHDTLKDLEPATHYYTRVWIKRDDSGPIRAGAVHEFRTPPEPDASQDVSFLAFTCFNHARSKDLKFGVWPEQGFRMFRGIEAERDSGRLSFDFAVFNGDTVYLDKQRPPYRPRPDFRPDDVRARYFDSYLLPLSKEFFRRTPVYFQKDDHDWRFNDSDPVYSPSETPPKTYSELTKLYRGPPGPRLGKEIFEEMHPVERGASNAPYRTFRWGRGLQIWLLESRECRYPNDRILAHFHIKGLVSPQEHSTPYLVYPDYCGTPAEDEEWGPKQFDWLLRTLKESDADFKIVINPTPALGPDQNYYVQLAAHPLERKADSQVRRFRGEFTRFLQAVREEKLKNVYIVAGDRHFIWHSRYQSRDGQFSMQEFGTGPLADDVVPFGKIFYKDSEGKASLVEGLRNSGFVHVQVEDVATHPKLHVEWYYMADWKESRIEKWEHTFDADMVH